MATAPTARTARTARQRVREEMTAEILTAAREQLAREGGAALSLRSVARDLEMAPSALYRYFDGRDALLSALILSAYESLATEAERAAVKASKAASGDVERFLAVPRALRGWALARPHEWGLIFGTPVPGYQAPEATVEPYARIAEALVLPVLEAQRAGRVRSDRRHDDVSEELRAAVEPVSVGLVPTLSMGQVVAVVQTWTTLIGAISLEVFGHWRNTVLDPEVYFDATIRDVAATLGLAD